MDLLGVVCKMLNMASLGEAMQVSYLEERLGHFKIICSALRPLPLLLSLNFRIEQHQIPIPAHSCRTPFAWQSCTKVADLSPEVLPK